MARLGLECEHTTKKFSGRGETQSIKTFGISVAFQTCYQKPAGVVPGVVLS